MSVEVLPLSVRGLRPESRKVDRDLWLWFCEAKKESENYDGPRVTKRLVQAKAKEAFEAAGICNFKASDGWYFRWLKRWRRVGLNHVIRLKNEDQTSSSTAHVSRKQISKRFQLNAVNNGKTHQTTDYVSEAGSSTGSPTHAPNVTDSFITNLYLGMAASVPEGTLQVVNDNVSSQNIFLPSSGNNIALPTQILYNTSCDLADTVLDKDYALHNRIEGLEPVSIDVQHPPDNVSIVNLDDLAWNDISDFSCFEKHGPKVSEAGEIRNQSAVCPSKVLPTEREWKLTPKGRGKMCGKKASSFHKDESSLSLLSVRHVQDTIEASVGPFNQEELKEAYVRHVNIKSLCLSSKIPSKIYSGHGKTSFLTNRGDFTLGRPIEKSKREKTCHVVLKETVHSAHDANYADFEEASCGNFSHHYLEDVSVSSDFVNQLNDEHSFELNLECENDNLVNQASSKTSGNKTMFVHPKFGNGNGIEHPGMNGFINPISPASIDNSTPSNDCGSPQSGSHMNVAEEDLSSEENDYISKAVMLSMQEDDFSILNCDQSPFQGSISIIDENSQSESEKLKDLEEGVRTTLTAEVDSGEMLFPPNVQSEYEITSVFPYVERVTRGSAMKTSSSSQGINHPGKSTRSFHTILKKSCPIQGLDGDHLQSELQSEELQDVPCLSSLSSEQYVNPKIQHELPTSSPSDEVSSSKSLCPSFYGDSTYKEHQNSFSSMDTDEIVERDNLHHISSARSEIAVIKIQDLFHKSSSGEADMYMSEQDVFVTCQENGRKMGLPQASSNCFSIERQDCSDLLVSENCVPNVEGNDCMYYVPCVSGVLSEPNMVAPFNPSTLNLISSSTSIMENSLHPDNGAHSEVTVANADSTTVLLTTSPYHALRDSFPKLIALSSSNTFVHKNTLLHTSQANQVGTKHIVSSPALSPRTDSSGCTTQIDSSSSPVNCESPEENAFTPFDLQLVESVLSEQDDNPENSSNLPNKNSAYIAEKGNATPKSSSLVEENQTYLRSSGDRYFPYFKRRVVDYAIKHTAKEAARYFGVNVDSVTMWTSGRHESDSLVKNFPDQHMLQWLKKNRESDILLTREQIAQKAIELLKIPGISAKDKTRWFYVWASRLACDEEKKRKHIGGKLEPAPHVPCLEKKALYPEEFKVEVALYAEQTSKNLAASVFKIARKRIFEWSAAFKVAKRADEENSVLINQNVKSVMQVSKAVREQESHFASSISGTDPKKLKLNSKGIGRAVTSADVDQALWLWFCEQTAQKKKPKSKEIRAKAVELFRAHNHDKIQCSHGWLKKWSLRYGIALRHEGDSDLLAWCLEQFDCNQNISHRDLLNYAHESLTGTHKSEFKASAGWLVRFCKRHRNLLSKKPSIDTEIPEALKQKVCEFRLYVQNMIHSSRTPIANVGCMDEVPLNFTAGGSRSRLLLRRSGLENCHAIVILSCLASGELLPPAVVFKGEGITEQVVYDNVPLLIFYQKDCCMSTTIMSQWLDLVWSQYVTSPSVLVADCYNPHCSDEIQKKCCASNTSLAIIPAGCSFKLQPLDLSISQLFEANIYDRWTKHFSTVGQLSCRRTNYSSNTDIAHWVAEAYSSLKQRQKEAIQSGFVVTGLTSSLNGAEDHLLEDPSYTQLSSPCTSHW